MIGNYIDIERPPMLRGTQVQNLDALHRYLQRLSGQLTEAVNQFSQMQEDGNATTGRGKNKEDDMALRKMQSALNSFSAARTLTIGGKSCTFYGPSDATFELSDMPGYDDALAAARTDGASSVILSATGWVGGSNVVSATNGKNVRIDLPPFTTSGGDEFNDEHKTTVHFYTDSVGAPLQDKVVDATPIYDAGYANAVPMEVSRVATYDSAANAYQVSVVVKSADGATKTFSLVGIDAASAYDAGYAAGFQAAKDATKVTGGITSLYAIAANTFRADGWASAKVDGVQVDYTTFSKVQNIS